MKAVPQLRRGIRYAVGEQSIFVRTLLTANFPAVAAKLAATTGEGRLVAGARELLSLLFHAKDIAPPENASCSTLSRDPMLVRRNANTLASLDNIEAEIAARIVVP